MQVIATHRYARISAFKAREVTREIQGLPAVDALQQLGFIPKKAAPLIAKTLKSAIANAEHNNNIRPELLVIKEAVKNWSHEGRFVNFHKTSHLTQEITQAYCTSINADLSNHEQQNCRNLRCLQKHKRQKVLLENDYREPYAADIDVFAGCRYERI